MFEEVPIAKITIGTSERIAIGRARKQQDRDEAAKRRAEGWKKRGKNRNLQ
jgi:hypothetical protein